MRALFPRFLEAEQKHGSVLRAFRQIRQPKSQQRRVHVAARRPRGDRGRAACACCPAGSVTLNAAVSPILVGQASADYRPRRLDSGERSRGARGRGLHAGLRRRDAAARALDAELAALCGDIPYASSATVTLGYRREDVAHPLRGSGFVVPRVEGTTIMAGSWISSKWRDARARTGGSCCAPSSAAPAILGRMERERRGADCGVAARDGRAARHPRRAGLHAAPPLGARQRPARRRPPRPRRGDRPPAGSRVPGLFVTGSGFRGVGVPDCVADARATAGQVAGWLASTDHRTMSHDHANCTRPSAAVLAVRPSLLALCRIARPRATAPSAQAQPPAARAAQAASGAGPAPELRKLLGQIKQVDTGQLAVSEEDGRLLRVLAASTKRAKRALEIGGGERLQRHLDRPRPARDRRPAGDDRVRPGRARRRPPRTSAARASPTSSRWCTATRSRRSRSCRAPSTSCSSTRGRATTSGSWT